MQGRDKSNVFNWGPFSSTRDAWGLSVSLQLEGMEKETGISGQRPSMCKTSSDAESTLTVLEPMLRHLTTEGKDPKSLQTPITMCSGWFSQGALGSDGRMSEANTQWMIVILLVDL